MNELDQPVYEVANLSQNYKLNGNGYQLTAHSVNSYVTILVKVKMTGNSNILMSIYLPIVIHLMYYNMPCLFICDLIY